MTSSSKRTQVSFKRASLYKYVSNTDYTAVAATDRVYIFKNEKVVKWQPLGGFHTIETAERFLNCRDFIHATEDAIGISTDDFAYVLEAYNFDLVDTNEWVTKVDTNTTLYLKAELTEFILNIQEGKEVNVQTFDTVSDLIFALDSFYTDADIYTSTAIQVGQYISAAINVRDLSKNLVRVKSSNIWAYGMNLRDRKDKTGEVVVQFKGNKGGPGDVYIYYDVPLVVWRKWLSATSKGHYFWMYIRNTYQYSKLTGDKRGKLRNAINR